MSATDVRRLAFSMLRGMNLEVAREALSRVGSVDAFFDMPQRELWQLIGAQKAWCSDAARAEAMAKASREAYFINEKKVRALAFDDSGYPRRLLDCDDAPAMLYALGDCDLNSPHVLAVVGTRKCTAYGSRMTSELISGLAEKVDGLVIVSGLAYGIDVAAHRAALDNNVPTVAVVAHGLTTIYPADHRDVAARIVRSHGAIVTEYPSDAPTHRGNFLARNRIVAGMSVATLVVESDLRGGSMVTAAVASAYGREVLAVPGRVTDRYSAGPNGMIHDNRAALVRDADDIIDTLGWQRRPVKGEQTTLQFDDLDAGRRQVVDFLRLHPDATINDMVEELAVPYPQLSARIMEMEMDDQLTMLPGGKYQLNM